MSVRYNFTLEWSDRAGTKTTYTVHGNDGDELEDLIGLCDYGARQMGYEGHKGGWWRYFLCDLGLMTGSPPMRQPS